MKLRLRFLLLMTVIFCGLVSLTWFLSSQLMSRINEKWGSQFVERQVMFDKYRTLSPLIREISLARKMAADPDIIQMALHENDPALRRKGISAMESYRFNFRDHSYFAAIASSGNYYFNDSANQFEDKQFRYVLSPNNANDQWFYATIADGKEYQVNLDPDVHLGVTKVWINVLIKNGDETLGVIGTGLDLTNFLRETVSIAQHGVHNLFIDKSMAIQLHDDPKLIDYMGIAKDASQRTKVDRLLKEAADIEQLRVAMQQLEAHPDQFRTMWVTFEGSKHLLGIAFLPEVGWYDLTLMEPQRLILFENRFFVPLMFGAAFLMALIAMGQGLRRWVLKPIADLQNATDKIHHGDFDIDVPVLGTGEIALLSHSFAGMANHVRDTNRDLENKVRERTDELRRINEYEQFRSHTLELMAGDKTLPIILKAIVQGVEKLNPTMICSILLLDSEGKHLEKGVAPSLPDFYNKALDGVEIGIGVGSCGTAAFTGERVIVSDITTHPYWAPYKELAAKAELKACWSEPILSSSHQVLGTFAIYHHDASTPTESDIATIEQTARLTSIVIEHKRMEEQVHEMAFRDTLTQLPNRRLLNDRLTQTLAVGKRSGRYSALLFLDMDNFKPLNDTYGHEVGDLLLIEVARRISSCIRETDTVARFGGDEFVVILSELDDEVTESGEQARIVAEKIRDALSDMYLLTVAHGSDAGGLIEHHCSSSIGVVLFNHTANRDTVLKRADMAMYEAKNGGRNRVVVTQYDGAVQDSSVLRFHWHEAYNCGDATIDREHRQLFELANILVESAFVRNENPDRFVADLEKLLTHVVQHFADEEAILAQNNYIDLEAHAHAHRMLIEHALKLKDAAVAGGVSVGELVDFIADEVIVQHMIKMDRQFYSSINKASTER